MSGRAAAAGCYSVGPPRQSIPWSALSEIGIAVSPGSEYLVHRRGFLAGTPGIEVTTGYQLPFSVADGVQFILRRIGGAAAHG